jgi:EmrB/QacA subfamily drug resistance transporter
LPQIAKSFSANETDLQWVINAYVLAFAGLLLTGAALGDRYGRKLMFVVGIVIFTLASVACALSQSTEALIAARVAQGVGAAAILPLSLTILSDAVPEKMRSASIGIWSGINGLGIALGPLVGGAVTEGVSWKWIFWLNVPVAVVAIPLVLWAIRESRGRDRGLDIAGMVLVTGAVIAAVWGIVRAGDDGWSSRPIVTAFTATFVLLVLFVLWERRAANPLLPLRFYRIPSFVLSNIVSLAMYFGVFGSIFFLAQYLQGPLGFSPLSAGLRTLPWTAMPMLVAPLAGLVTDRVGGGKLMAAGLALQGVALSWIALIAAPDIEYTRLVPAMVIGGIGMGLVFAPTTAVVLGSVRRHEAGKASGANNTVREVGGALGVAVLTTVFTHYFKQVRIRSAADAGHAFVHGMQPAIWVGVLVVGVGAIAGLFIRRRVSPDAEELAVADPVVAEVPVTDDATDDGRAMDMARIS